MILQQNEETSITQTKVTATLISYVHRKHSILNRRLHSFVRSDPNARVSEEESVEILFFIQIRYGKVGSGFYLIQIFRIERKSAVKVVKVQKGNYFRFKY